MMLDTQANVPASVAVVFPRADSSILGTDVYEVSVTLASLALTEYDGEFGRPGVSQIIHSTAVANYSGGGSPVNAAELLALAQQIATDFYLWRLALVEARYRSIVPWTADGMHDVEWMHGGGMTTAVHRSEWDPEFGQLKHAGTYGSSDVPAATGITHINNDATALQQIAIGDAGTDLNIATTAAAYDNAKTYSAGWVVLSSGSTYRFINATPSAGHSPPNATYWEDVTGQGLTIVNVPDATPTSINGDSTPAQILAYGTAGTDFAIVDVGPTHTFNLPSASATARGVVTTGNQTLGSTGTTKTFAGAVTVTQAGLFLSTTEFRNTASFLGQAYASNPDIYCHWISGGYARIDFQEAANDGDPNIITLTAPFGLNNSPGHCQAKLIIQSGGTIGQSGMVFDGSVLWSDVSSTWTSGFSYTINSSYVENSGTGYRCIQSHTASSTNEPGTGTDQADYWVAVSSIAPGTQINVSPIISVRKDDGTLVVAGTGTFAGLDFVSGFLTGGTFLVPVKSGGTGRTTLDSGQLIAGAGTSAVDSLSSTRVVGEAIELKLGSDSWIAFSEGSF